ncbi:MAG: pre-peptidase C-terminal domain-containing protein, partial [Aggregatilineales bacterium]
NTETLEESRMLYEASLEMETDNLIALYNLGLIAKEQERFDDALDLFNGALDESPDDVDSLTQRGIVYDFLEQPQNALTDFNRALELNPNYDLAYARRGFIYQDSLNEPELALTDFRQYVELLGDDAAEVIVERIAILEAEINPDGTPVAGITPQPADIIMIDTDGNYEYTGEITADQPEFRFQFEAAAGDMLGVQMQNTSGDLDPLVLLLNAQGDTLILNDDDPQGTGRDSYIREYMIPADGTYIIVASRFQRDLGTTAGSFVLRLIRDSETTADATPSPADLTLLEYGTTLTGQLGDETPELFYAFEGQAGDSVNIQLNATSGDLDPYLLLTNEDFEVLFENDDDPRAAGRDAFLREIILPADGIYFIGATRFQGELGTTAGDFELILERIDNSA